MSARVRKLSASAADAGAPLAVWLARRLGLDEAAAAALVQAGAVYLRGRRERDPACVLAAGDKLVVHEPEAAPAASATPGWRVLLDAAEVIVVDKPAGLAVQATRAAAGALDEQVAARFPGARLVHRIDAATSGLVLFGRGDGVARFSALFRDGRVERDYLAVVAVTGAAPPPEAAFVIDAPLGPDPRDRRRQAAGVPGGRAARTQVLSLQPPAAATRALVRCRLDTGRTHQVRVHLAHAGLPVLGDALYAPAAVAAAAPRLALHATRLAWPGGAPLESPLPPELAALLP